MLNFQIPSLRNLKLFSARQPSALERILHDLKEKFPQKEYPAIYCIDFSPRSTKHNPAIRVMIHIGPKFSEHAAISLQDKILKEAGGNSVQFELFELYSISKLVAGEREVRV